LPAAGQAAQNAQTRLGLRYLSTRASAVGDARAQVAGVAAGGGAVHAPVLPILLQEKLF